MLADIQEQIERRHKRVCAGFEALPILEGRGQTQSERGAAGCKAESLAVRRLSARQSFERMKGVISC